MPQELNFDKTASDRILSGVNKLANAVKVTLGPKGRNVILERSGVSPHITKDGVTVANSITLEDPVENMGAQLVKDVASKTAYEAGDGTTTATVLAQAIYSLGLQQKGNPMGIKRGIDKAVTRTVELIRQMAIPVTSDEQLRQVATISANGDANIAEIVVSAVKAVGQEGIVTIEEGMGFATTVETTTGYQFGSGYTVPQFVNSPGTNTVEFNAPLFLIYDGKLHFMKQMQSILEQVMQAKRPLVIICDDIDGEALKVLAVNNAHGRIQVATVRAPYHGDRKIETLRDIAEATAGLFISEDAGMKIEDVKLHDLGTAESVSIARTETIIVGGSGKPDLAPLRLLVENTEEEFMKDWYKQRLARLSGGAAVIKVGASSEVEMKEIKDRIDDALQATRAAIAEGILPGGGSVLAKLSVINVEADDADEQLGVNVLQTAIQAPLRAIVENSGAGENIVTTVIFAEGNYGWNARTGEWGDLIEMGVIDPAKVTRLALENAASVAGLLLTTKCVVYNKS